MPGNHNIADAVTKEVVVDASIERVWELITKPEHLQAWWAFDGAKVDLQLGGIIEHFWREHGRYRGIIDDLDEPTRLSYRYSSVPDADPKPGQQTQVVFTLEPASSGGTLVRVVESGFADLNLSTEEQQAHKEATEEGWTGGLNTLAALAVE